MATTAHTPRGRGFDSALGYFHHTNDYWNLRGGEPCPSNATGHGWHTYTKEASSNVTSRWLARDGYLAAGDDWIPARSTTLPAAEALCGGSAECRGFTFEDYHRRPPEGKLVHCAFKRAVHFVEDRGLPFLDLWLDEGPAPPAYRSPQPQCSGTPYPTNASGCTYEDDLFAAHVVQAVRGWRPGKPPLFVYWATHAVHSYVVPLAPAWHVHARVHGSSSTGSPLVRRATDASSTLAATLVTPACQHTGGS